MIKQNDVKPGDVERIDCGANSKMTTTLLHHRPTNGLQAKFSMEYALAILLLERKAGLAEFTDETVTRPDVQDWLTRVNFYVDSEAEAAGFSKMTSLIKIHLKSGKVLSGQATMAKGSPSNPMSYEDAAEKFRGCAEFAKWPTRKTRAIIKLVRSLERESDMSRLTAALTA